MARTRTLAVVLGDQLDRQSSIFDEFDPAQDRIWMAEVSRESTHVWSHKARIAIFLSAMRHFRDEMRERGIRVEYRALEDKGNLGSLRDELRSTIERLKPARVVVVEPGDYRVKQELLEAAPEIEILPDRHFLCSLKEFREHAGGRKQLRLEFFYRDMRRAKNVLMDGKEAAGGSWNFDAENRKSFPASGPQKIPPRRRFEPDAVTKKVLALVEREFGHHPGRLDSFDWPVTPEQAEQALSNFIETRLAQFGDYQDAMWTDEPWLYHAHISSSLNLKLLHPRTAIDRAEQAWRERRAPLAAVEGFIRQILGWREYVRGIYWTFMPGYADHNALDAHEKLPAFYWDGKTDSECLRQSLGQTLDFGYAHHIQRLMVTGLYALLLGVEPKQVHEWYLAVYVDAVEWAELPNTIGMSQFADGGLMASKPYAATGKYIQRMSNYCKHCRYDPAEAVGDDACPFTTLYWDFLLRNESKLKKVPRMEMQLRNLTRLTAERKQAIEARAKEIKENRLVQIQPVLI
jgi:deoxyribodipyrimidine photolyase-related protein